MKLLFIIFDQENMVFQKIASFFASFWEWRLDLMPKIQDNNVENYYRKADRSSRLHVFFKIGVLKNFTIFTGNHLPWSLYFNQVAGLRQA